MKRIVVLVLILTLIISISNFNVAFSQNNEQTLTQDEITAVFNSKKIEFDVKPYVKNGRTLVPFRKILETFGAVVEWDADQQVGSAKKGTTEVYLKVGVDYAYVNGYKVNLDVPPEIKDGRVLIPLRFVSENLGAEVNWDGATRTITITYDDTVYKLGQVGSGRGLKFSIDSAGFTAGLFRVIGKISSDKENITIEAVDENGFTISETAKIVKQNGEFYDISAELSLPTCHNFVAKYIVIKVQNADQKVIKLGEYSL